MLNKKLLAASIAALFTVSAHAAIDIDLTTVPAIAYGAEAITAPEVRDDFLVITDAGAAGAFDVIVNAGFSIPVSTTRYVRMELGNARFNGASNIGNGSLANATTGVTITLVTGVADKANTALFQVTTNGTDPVAITSDFTFAPESIEISQTASTTITYTMHETLTSAVAGTGALYSKSAAIASVKATTTGDVANADTLTASVASDFKQFATGGGFISTTLGTVGEATSTAFLTGGSLDSDSGAVALTDVLDASQVITFDGDFSFGDWAGNVAANCAGTAVAVTLNTDKTEAATGNYNITAGDVYLCLNNATKKDVVLRGSYGVTLEDDELTGSLGSIVYDTTSIAIPYLTTFADYNQRVYIINSSSKAAPYTTSFRSEEGVTATAGTAATGTVAANSVLAIKASDLVTLTGKTRTSATIEIEALGSSVTATTQTVNLSDGSTDTVALAVD